MVEGARLSLVAIARTDKPSASPREISSRSASASTRGERRRVAGTYPPLEATTPWIEPGCFPRARPISLRDSPAFHRDHSSRFCSCLNPGRPLCAIRPPPDRCRTILGVAPTGRNQGHGRRLNGRRDRASARGQARSAVRCRRDLHLPGLHGLEDRARVTVGTRSSCAVSAWLLAESCHPRESWLLRCPSSLVKGVSPSRQVG